jgi:shikimate dehydrogenase
MENISFIHTAQFGFQTPIYCIISDERVYRTRSPQMYNRILQQMGLTGAYVPFMVTSDDLGRALESLKVLHISGANITAPYKEKACRFVDVLSEGAQIIGSINTIVCKAGLLKGYNTNAIGFMDALSSLGIEVAKKRILVFGNGGMARAVAFILNWLRADKVMIVGRNKARTWALADQFSGQGLLLSDLDDQTFSVDIVVNATSVSSPDESPELSNYVSRLSLSGCHMILDLNYGRGVNFWQKRAEELEVAFEDGLSTLAFQARRTFSLWTGMDVPPQAFLNALQPAPAHKDGV